MIPLTSHPNWADFSKRYALDLCRFSIEVCGRVPSAQQELLFKSVEELGSRTTVSSGHSTGKTGAIGVIILWFLVCYHKSNHLVTAPKIKQVRNLAWKEVADLKEVMDRNDAFQWLVPYVIVETEKVYIEGNKKTWFCIAITAPRGSPESLAGFHRKFYMVTCDEASGIPDDNYGVLTGGVSGEHDRMLMTSQPTKPSGFFRDSHFKLARHIDGYRTANKNGAWNAFTFSSVDSPFASTKFILEKKEQYSLEQFQIKVLGKFPENIDGFLLGRKEVEDKCFHYDHKAISDDDNWGYISSLDIGGGSYRDSSVMLTAKVCGDGDYGDNARRVHITSIPFYSNSLNEHEFSSRVWQLLVTNNQQIDTLLIDAGGIGKSVENFMERKGAANMIGVQWGVPCFKRKNKEMFINKRAQANVAVAKAVRSGRLTFAEDILQRAQILDEASRIPFKFDDNARYQIEKKDRMRADGIPSPDIWDAVCFMFMEGVYYTPHIGVRVQFDDAKQAAIDEMIAEGEHAFDDA